MCTINNSNVTRNFYNTCLFKKGSSLPEKQRRKTLMIDCTNLQKKFVYENATPNCLVLSLGWGFETLGDEVCQIYLSPAPTPMSKDFFLPQFDLEETSHLPYPLFHPSLPISLSLLLLSLSPSFCKYVVVIALFHPLFLVSLSQP